MIELGIRGQSIVRVCFDAAVVIVTSGDCELRVETQAALVTSAREKLLFDPESPKDASPHLVDLVDAVVFDAEAEEDGELAVGFEGGRRLIVQPDVDYEAWTFVDPTGLRLTCMPGGEIAVWKKKE